MFKHTKLCTGLVIAFGSMAIAPGFALAQDAVLQRVEITGSAIKRLDAETSEPVTVLKAVDLKKEGVVTVEQVLNLIAGNQSLLGSSQSVGLNTGGASFANMRGLGQNKTLVLLNGRRIANNSFDGSAPDLNMIPFAALDRIEVLRDGASSLYGTDAIGGVINFITKKDMTGGSITIGADSPQHPGGKSTNLNVGYGFGDLAKDGFNVIGFFDHQQQDEIKASQRPFGSTGYRPALGLGKSSGTPDPGNYFQISSEGTFSPGTNPSFPTCNAPFGFSKGSKCRYDYTRWVDLIPPTTRDSAMLKGTFAFNSDTQLNLEYFLINGTNKTAIAPVPYTALTMQPSSPFFPGNGITPAPTNFTIDPTLPIDVQWRTGANGPRRDESDSKQQRFLASLDGSKAGWDYSVGLAYNTNDVLNKLIGGYSDGGLIATGVDTGIVNPFGAQTPAGSAYLASTIVNGNLLQGKGDVWSLDAHGSRELADWFGAGRAAALAVGGEVRTEKFSFKAPDPVYANKVVASTGVDPGTDTEGSRSVYAAYAELNVPITKQLEVTGAVRADKYSDFGSSVNPKVSFRFQPNKELLFRGSASTGFRAPSLYELNAPQTYTNTANSWDDPKAGCDANGVPTVAGFAPTACGQQFMSLSGGNKALKPEKSKSFTLGMVAEPVKDVTVGVDLWMIKLTDAIGSLPDTTIFGNTTKYAYLFHRAADGSLSIDGTDCPGVNCGYVLDTTMNLGGVNSSGIDLTLAYRLRTASAGTFNFNLNGTYVSKYEYQVEPGGAWIQNVGIYSGSGPVFRWQQTANVQWSYGEYGLGLTNRYKTGYLDQNDPTQLSCCTNNHVPAYSLWDINGSWAATKALSLVVGVRNLMDTKPPFSNQGGTFQTGYDPRLTDATGRAYYLRGTFNF